MVILAFPKTAAYSLKLRFVVMITLEHSYSLLVLDSDHGTDFMFCDCGVVEFYIQPADLAAKDSSKAYSLTAGG